MVRCLCLCHCRSERPWMHFSAVVVFLNGWGLRANVALQYWSVGTGWIVYFFSLVYGFYTGQWFRVWNLIVSSQDLLRFFWHCCVGRHAVWDSAHFAHSHLEGWSGPLTTKLNFIGNIWSESFYLNNAFLFFLLRTNGWLMDFFLFLLHSFK